MNNSHTRIHLKCTICGLTYEDDTFIFRHKFKLGCVVTNTLNVRDEQEMGIVRNMSFFTLEYFRKHVEEIFNNNN